MSLNTSFPKIPLFTGAKPVDIADVVFAGPSSASKRSHSPLSSSAFSDSLMKPETVPDLQQGFCRPDLRREHTQCTTPYPQQNCFEDSYPSNELPPREELLGGSRCLTATSQRQFVQELAHPLEELWREPAYIYSPPPQNACSEGLIKISTNSQKPSIRFTPSAESTVNTGRANEESGLGADFCASGAGVSCPEPTAVNDVAQPSSRGEFDNKQYNLKNTDRKLLEKMDNTSNENQPQKFRRGRKRQKDIEYLELGYTQLEGKLAAVQRAKNEGIPFAERRRMRNHIQSLRTRLKHRERGLMFDRMLRSKDEKMSMLLEVVSEVLTDEQQNRVLNRTKTQWDEVEQSDEKLQAVQITKKGLKLSGTYRPRPVHDGKIQIAAEEEPEEPQLQVDQLSDLQQIFHTPEYVYDYFAKNEEESD